MKLKVPPRVAKTLQHMHPTIKKKLKYGLKQLIENPELGKSLKEELDGLRSFRVSRYRIIYRIQKKYLEIVAIGPRAKIYQDTLRLLKD
ncbi:MAG: type II toxin-antitoxin system RelE/ParE family toxin [Deltaproteobacteria bacterium]|nr:type II toxin-antitoxin system RelE/ParE family toxin [Deltaproteobacteria bacterium]